MPYRQPFIPNSHTATTGSGGGGAIALTLDRIPFTLTELFVNATANFTIVSPSGVLDDTWDRIFSSLTLQYGTTDYFQFTEGPQANALMKAVGMGMPRISFPSSGTSVTYSWWYRIHFGAVPFKYNKTTGRLEENPYDLTGAIPQLPANSLSLVGSWGSNISFATSGVTLNSATLTPYFRGIAAAPGENPSQYDPKAFPAWVVEDHTNDIASGYSSFGQSISLPISDWIQGVLFLSRINNLRSDGVLTDLKFRDTSGNRDIFAANNWTDITAVAQADRFGFNSDLPPSDGATAGTVAYPQVQQAGLLYLDMRQWISEPDPLYGLNMDPNVNPRSQLVWQMGTTGTAGSALKILYRKYKKNVSAASAVPSAAMTTASGMHPAVAAAMAARTS